MVTKSLGLGESTVAAIAQAASLRESGALTEEEFKAIKANLMAPVFAKA